MEEKFADQKRSQKDWKGLFGEGFRSCLGLLVAFNLFAAKTVDIKPELS